MAHPWHDVQIGYKAPAIANAIIEIPKGSKAKYEIDKETGFVKLDRVLFSSVHYPANYGFLPRTYWGDGDPLDILVISQVDLIPGSICESKIIGAMQMVDGNDDDDKLISVAANDPAYNFLNDVSELPKHVLDEIRNFFETYKRLENKTVVVHNILNAHKAHEMVLQGLEGYKNHFHLK